MDESDAMRDGAMTILSPTVSRYNCFRDPQK